MIIRSALHKDYDDIAKLHKHSITTGFLSTLGHAFLRELYSTIGKQSDSRIFVAESDSHICGFVAGTVNTHGLYKRVLMQNWYSFMSLLLKFIFDMTKVRMLYETFLYGFKKKNHNDSNVIPTELLSISVDELFRGKGIGKKLVDELESFFKKSGVKIYKVVTFSEDRKANDFYKLCHFVLNRQFVHHQNLMNEYTKEI